MDSTIQSRRQVIENSPPVASVLERSPRESGNEMTEEAFDPRVDHWPVQNSITPIDNSSLIQSLKSKIETLKEAQKNTERIHKREIKLKEDKINELVSLADAETAEKLHADSY